MEPADRRPELLQPSLLHEELLVLPDPTLKHPVVPRHGAGAKHLEKLEEVHRPSAGSSPERGEDAQKLLLQGNLPTSLSIPGPAVLHETRAAARQRPVQELLRLHSLPTAEDVAFQRIGAVLRADPNVPDRLRILPIEDEIRQRLVKKIRSAPMPLSREALEE